MASNKRSRNTSRVQSRMRLQFHYEMNRLGRWYRIWTQHIDQRREVSSATRLAVQTEPGYRNGGSC